MITDIVYIGRDNANEWVLNDDDIPIDHSEITRAVIALSDGTEIDSDIIPSIFDFTNTDRMIVRLGMADGLEKGSMTATVAVYVPGSAHGIRYDTSLLLRIIE